MRIVRHWKQEFDPAGPFIFTREMQLESGKVPAGSDVPEDLAADGHRMKVWWKGGRIALKNWDYELGVPKAADEPLYEDRGGAWFLFKDGTKVHGKKALEAKLASLEV